MMFIPGPIISALTFPGVVIHELAHQLFCRLFKIPVHEVCYFRFGNPAGYVIHAQTHNWGQQLLVGVGPFIVNSLLGALLAFPSALRTFEFEGAAAPQDLVLMWLGISIAMHAIPSTGDAKSMWSTVSGTEAPIIGKLCVAPMVAVIYVLALGSFFWLDLAYGVAVSLVFPKLIVAALT